MKILVAFIVAFVLLVAGCSIVLRSIGNSKLEKVIESASNGEAEVKLVEDGTMMVRTKDGSFSMGKGLPDSWPKDVPVYPDSSVEFSGTGDAAGGEQSLAAVFVTDRDVSTVLDFYKEGFVAMGWKLENSMVSQDMTILVAAKEDRTASVSIGGVDGATSITVGVQSKE